MELSEIPDNSTSLHLHIMFSESNKDTLSFINKVTFSSKPLSLVEKLKLLGESYTFTKNGRSYKREIRTLRDANRFDILRQAVARSKRGASRGVLTKFQSKTGHSSGSGGKGLGRGTLGGLMGTLIIGSGMSLISSDAKAEDTGFSEKQEIIDDLFTSGSASSASK